MSELKTSLWATLLIVTQSCTGQVGSKKLDYPDTRVEEVSKDYHGTTVVDPYSWLGDNESDEVKSWVSAQDSLTTSFVRSSTFYSELKKKVDILRQVSRRTELPFQSDSYYYYLRQEEARKWSLVQRGNGNSKIIELPMNPRMAFFSVPDSKDNRLALGVMGRGQVIDWRVLDLSSGELSDEVLIGTAMSKTRLEWKNDASGFYYMSSHKVDDSGKRSDLTVKYHKIGDSYTNDQIIYRPENDGAKIELGLTDNDSYLVIEERMGSATAGKVSLYELATRTMQELVPQATASYLFLGNDGDMLIFETDDEAPNGKIVGIDAKKIKKGFKTIVPEGAESIAGYQSAGGSILPLMAGGKNCRTNTEGFEAQSNCL